MSANHGYALDPGLKGLLASVGVRHDEALRRAGLPEDLLNRSGVRVSTVQFYALAQAVQDAADDPLLPLRMVDGLVAEWFSPAVFAALCSSDLTVAVARLARFKPLVAPVRLQVADEGALRVAYHWLDGEHAPPWSLVGAEALSLVKLARMGTRHEVQPARVALPMLPRAREAFEGFLGCAIEEGPRPTLWFREADARRPFLTNHGAMWEIFEPQLQERLAELEGSATFAARTRAVLVEALPSGQGTVEAVARRLAVSARTLQRRLQDEGTSFQHEVRTLREHLARHYLTTTTLSATEIAYLLGFEEPASFFRAFQSWTGTTPEALRRARRG